MGIVGMAIGWAKVAWEEAAALVGSLEKSPHPYRSFPFTRSLDYILIEMKRIDEFHSKKKRVIKAPKKEGNLRKGRSKKGSVYKKDWQEV